MLKPLSKVGFLAGIMLSGCKAIPPSSTYPGLYSTTTGLQNLLAETGHHQPGFNDFDAIEFRLFASCRDTSKVLKMDWAALKSVPYVLPIGMPGCILLTKDGWGIDESEVPNIEWKRYQQRLAAAGTSIASTQLDEAALPVPDYFTNSFYDFYPVVGVSYKQAVAFCRWRSRVVSEAINTSSSKLGSPDSLAPNHIIVESRLPTEAEWEKAALAGRGLPYGSRCTEAPVQVNSKAAAYLKQRSGSTESVEKIRADIVAYNQTKPVRSFISYRQSEPYFLQLATPAYVFQAPANDYAVFYLLGNVAEMIQERGIAKGGSYRDPLAACTVTARASYKAPAPNIGFRCITRATHPNAR